MTENPNADGDALAGASWIARPVPPSQRIVRQVIRNRIDWAGPGDVLAQTFRAHGPVVAVNVDLVGPGDTAEAHGTDVKFTLTLETPAGDVLAERAYEGPQLVWDYFGPFLDITPPAPAGEYTVALRSERGRVGWSTGQHVPAPDDGVSPLPIDGVATTNGAPVPGARLVGVETLPAPNPIFRRVVHLDGTPVTAELTATVLGTGVIRINGTRVGDELLEPAVTDYDKTVLFRSWDVTHLITPGENEILLEAGRERYSARGGDTWGWHLAPWHREPVAAARLDLTDATGTTETIVTDAHWSTAPGAVDADRLFRGEDWVIRAAPPAYEPVQVVEAPAGTLRRAHLPPVRALPTLAARATSQVNPTTTVMDFGDVMVGRVRMVLSGTSGAAIRVVSGEQLSADGEVICDNFLVAGEAQVDTLRLEREVTDFTWEPQFGYRGFRWIQIETSGSVDVHSVRAVPMYTDLDVMGELSTDEPVSEWINAATARTFRNNLHGIPTDTPIYEKNGWTADAHLATEGLLHHFDLRSAFGKWIGDHIDAQSEDGAIPQIVPTPGWGSASDPAWSISAVLIPWYLYREYGDITVLEQSADMIRRFVDQLQTRLIDGIWRDRTWGDWLAPGHMLAPEGMAPTGTIMTVSALQHATSVMRAIGDVPAAESYNAAAVEVAAAYHREWFDTDRGGYAVPGVGYRQAMNILPLAFQVVPDAHVDSVRAGLIDDLENRTDGHLDCGAIGVRHLLAVLTDAGRDDLALTVLTRRTRPGWGFWFDGGESTLLESWDADARSRNHYFLGSVTAWIQQRIGGLRLTAPGWSTFDIAPMDDPRVTTATISHRTPHGWIRVKWERGVGGWRFDLVVPDGATATIRVNGHRRALAAGAHTVHLSR